MLRLYEPKDLDGVVALGKRVATRVSRPDTDSDPEVLGANLAQMREDPHYLVLVSESDIGNINGILVGVIGSPIWNKSLIAKDLLFGAEGCGEELLQFYTEWARDAGASMITTHCNSGSQRTEEFYTNIGATKIGHTWEISNG